MAIIDPVGFLSGERIGACSDEAQYHWPRLVAASNSFGRIKLDYESIISTVYRSIKKPPTPEKLAILLAEYRDNFLLFIYVTPKGETWGEWLIPDHLKSKYHTAADRRSPQPPKEELELYRQSYVESIKHKSSKFNDILKPLSKTPILKVNSEISKTAAVVNGIGIDDVKGNTNTLAQPSVERTTPEPISAERIFKQYPRHRRVGKGAALKAIDKAAHRLRDGEMCEQGAIPLQQAYEMLKQAVEAYARSPAGNAGEFTPHPATWFNQSRYLDDPLTWKKTNSGKEQRYEHEGKYQRLQRELAMDEAAFGATGA